MKTEPAFSGTFKSGLKSGIKKGLSGFLWMLKILLPISFATMLIDQSGLIDLFGRPLFLKGFCTMGLACHPLAIISR